ncbi:ATP-dependent RNA helicase DeaD [Arboricoccus pini]|uniref:ATP-dependent RNA helicase DeaD n=1 Tax=Arboricoccus pini TaxID=1963835 RepID=A0A212QSI0_9PROT|nr:DEAD/DEAH box helicase [Arboricoccus pini]SNB62416.1 ATP-dependent RNA helicase DeaD [Arboricoccus pini]
MSFPSTHPALAEALAQRGYATPTAVQAAVLEAGNAERDLLVSAQTGSGKTVAFGLAAAPTLLGDSLRFDAPGAPLALIVAPTRELALQVNEELSWLYAATGARIATAVGGMDIRREHRALAAGAHIVVGTPGRIRDHLERGKLDTSALRVVVLDEADEMLDLGFREDLEFILEGTPASRRTLLFSATLARNIITLTKRYQRDALRIDTLDRGQPHADIDYRAVDVLPAETDAAIVNVLRFYESPASLVFCATREAVRRLHMTLLDRGFSAVALSGELSQHERNTALDAMRAGRARICVATDVAARGLDLPELDLVVHADLPTNHATLLHRSGRTGRAGRKGVSVLIVPSSRRLRAEQLLYRAGLQAVWSDPPTAAQIEARDQTRFLADPLLQEPATASDQEAARALLAKFEPERLAAVLVRLYRARLPLAADVTVADSLPEGSPTKPLNRRERRAAMRGNNAAAAGTPEPVTRAQVDDSAKSIDSHRRGEGRFAPMPAVWFSLPVGRRQNADPKWLVPMICRLGQVTKQDIGRIQIDERETRFEIAEGRARAFSAALAAAKDPEVQISTSTAPTGPARHPRRASAIARLTERPAGKRPVTRRTAHA